MRVLITGMSATGKSTLVRELVRRGYVAYDADDDGFSEPRANGRWGWRTDAITSLLGQIPTPGLLFFAGCSEEQGTLPFELRVLLTASEDEIVRRLQTRTTNPYGRTPDERRQVLADRALIEPLLRRSADLVLDAAMTTHDLADQLVAYVLATASASNRHA